MSTKYVVKPGDSLGKIAVKFHVRSWTDIYNDPENVGFKRRRPNPNLIFAGDVVMIPDPPGSFNQVLPDPPYVIQSNTFWCWAAAMESWLSVTPERDPVSQTKLRERFKDFTDPDNGGLTPEGWGAVASAFNMEGQSFTANGLPGSFSPAAISPKFIYATLKKKGFIVIVYNLAPGGPAHTNVIYGIQSTPAATFLNVMDPEEDGGGLITRSLDHYTNRDFVGLLWAR